jgi:hypothetical protein
VCPHLIGDGGDGPSPLQQVDQSLLHVVHTTMIPQAITVINLVNALYLYVQP